MPDPSEIAPMILLPSDYIAVLAAFYAAKGLKDTVEIRIEILASLKGELVTETPTIEKLHELELWFLTEHLQIDVHR